MKHVGIGICAGCRKNLPLFREAFGAIPKCRGCLKKDWTKGVPNMNVEMFRNTTPVVYPKDRKAGDGNVKT